MAIQADKNTVRVPAKYEQMTTSYCMGLIPLGLLCKAPLRPTSNQRRSVGLRVPKAWRINASWLK